MREDECGMTDFERIINEAALHELELRIKRAPDSATSDDFHRLRLLRRALGPEEEAE